MTLKLTVLGSFGGLIVSCLLFPLFVFLVGFYDYIKGWTGYLLVVVVFFLIMSDNKKLWAVIVFFLSGFLGYTVLNFPGLRNPLFPLLSGLFGVATLALSLGNSSGVPEQRVLDYIDADWRKGVKALLSGQFSGFLTAVLPGVGSSSAAVISSLITRDLGDHGFMVLLGSVNTVNFVLSLASFLVLDKARNGSVIAVKELVGSADMAMIVVFIAVALMAGSASVFLALRIGVLFSRVVNRVNYDLLVSSVIVMICVMGFFLSGFLGLFVLFVSACIGLVPALVKVRRTHAMGCLMFPVILYFLS